MFKDIYSGIKKNKHKRVKYLVSCICIIAFIFSIIALPLSPVSLIPEATASTEENSQDTNLQFPQIGDPSELYPDSNIYSFGLDDWQNDYNRGSHSVVFPNPNDESSNDGKAYPFNGEERLTTEVNTPRTHPEKFYVLDVGEWKPYIFTDNLDGSYNITIRHAQYRFNDKEKEGLAIYTRDGVLQLSKSYMQLQYISNDKWEIAKASGKIQLGYTFYANRVIVTRSIPLDIGGTLIESYELGCDESGNSIHKVSIEWRCTTENIYRCVWYFEGIKDYKDLIDGTYTNKTNMKIWDGLSTTETYPLIIDWIDAGDNFDYIDVEGSTGKITIYFDNSTLKIGDKIEIDPSLSVSTTATTITVASSNFPSNGWNMTFDKADGSTITQLYMADNSTTNLCAPKPKDQRWYECGSVFQITAETYYTMNYGTGKELVLIENSATKVVVKTVGYLFSTSTGTHYQIGGTDLEITIYYTIYPNGYIAIDTSANLVNDKVYTTHIRVGSRAASGARDDTDWTDPDTACIYSIPETNYNCINLYSLKGLWNDTNTFGDAGEDVRGVWLEYDKTSTNNYTYDSEFLLWIYSQESSKDSNQLKDYKTPATFSEILGTQASYNRSIGAYQSTVDATDDRFNQTMTKGSYDRYYPVFLLQSYDSSTLYVRINGTNTTWSNGTEYLAGYNSTINEMTIWINSTINGNTQFEFQSASFSGGDPTYTLQIHIVLENADDSSKADYWYGWCKLANEYWNVTAYGQLNSTGGMDFTNLAAGDYYLEIYPPEGSGVYGVRIGCTNVTISSNATLTYPIYDYRGRIIMNWNYDAATGTSNMTQYILDRMEGTGCQKGDIIKIYVGYDYPTDSINANWGKSNFTELLIALKQQGYRIFIEPRFIYTAYYDFWTQLDDYNDTGYSDGDYYNEGTENNDFRSHNAFMQFEARLTTVMGDGGDVNKALSDYALCLVQEDYWDVYDVNDSAYLTYGSGAEEWSFSNTTGNVTIHSSENNHLYEIYFMQGSDLIASPISNLNSDPYWVRERLLELMEWFYENCTLDNGECAIDGISPNYCDWHALGAWNTWEQAFSGMCTKVTIDWFLGNYTQYASDFKLSWVTYEGTASEFARGRNDTLPFMNDWLYFREQLLHEDFWKPIINQAHHYNVSVMLYDGDDSRGNSGEWVTRLGCDLYEHQKTAGLDDDFMENYVNYWSTRIPFACCWIETWQDANDNEALRTELQRASALGCLPAIMYNHQSTYNYVIPEENYDEYSEAHGDFREAWKTYKQLTEWKIAKVYIMVDVVSRQTSFFYGGSDGSRITPLIQQLNFLYDVPAQLDYISNYFIEENGIPDDCDLLVIAGRNVANSPEETYHTLYSDTLNSTITSYVTNGGAVWVMGDVGRYATNGSNSGTGYWEKLLELECINATWANNADYFYVNESSWIINANGIIDLVEGWDCGSVPTYYGEPEWEGLRSTNFADGMFNLTASADANDVIIWYGNNTWKLPYLYIRDDIGSGNIAYTPYENTLYWQGERIYETLLRTFYYLTNNTDRVHHVNITLENFYSNQGSQLYNRTREKFMYYGLYNTSYAWLLSMIFDPYDAQYQNDIPTFTTWVNFSDFMETGKDYVIYCFDRLNSTLNDNTRIYDSTAFSTTNKTLLTDESDNHLFQKGERIRFTFERDIVHWFVIVEAMSANVSLIQAKATNDTILVTNQGYVGDVYVINATAHTNTVGEFVVYCNRTINNVTINGESVSYNHNITTMLLTFNHTFSSAANIEINGGTDTTAPSIDSPDDESYTVGNIGQTIVWTVSDAYPNQYNVTRDGTLIENGSWVSGTLSIDIDGLSAGTYTFVMGINDTNGNSASDTVLLTVSAIGGGGGGGAGGGSDVPPTAEVKPIVKYKDTISQLENQTVSITVKDGLGKPVSDAIVYVEFEGHRYRAYEGFYKGVYEVEIPTAGLEPNSYYFEVEIYATQLGFRNFYQKYVFHVTSDMLVSEVVEVGGIQLTGYHLLAIFGGLGLLYYMNGNKTVRRKARRTKDKIKHKHRKWKERKRRQQ